MSIYQPTNITPDILGGRGNGVIARGENFTVSWDVNGTYPMWGYNLFFYTNDAASTLLYQTGVDFLDEPFYGIDGEGNRQRFEAEVTYPAAQFSGRQEIKMVIRQSWAEPEVIYVGDTFVDQKSPSIFYIRTEPTINITSPGTITSREQTINATISDIADNDSLSWVRWKLEQTVEDEQSGDDYQKIVKDTGRMYGVNVLQFSYDSFSSTGSYVLSVEAETNYGMIITSSINLTSSYSVEQMVGASLHAQSFCNSSAVEVLSDGASSIYGEATGEYEIVEGEINYLYLPSGSDVTWDTENGEALSIAAPWSFITKSKLLGLTSGSVNILTLTTGTNADVFVLNYNYGTRVLSLTNTNGSVSIFSSTVGYDNEVLVAITPTKWYLTTIGNSGALYPLTTLYPSTTRYPNAGVDNTVTATNGNMPSYTQQTIKSVKVCGSANHYFAVEVDGELGSATVAEIAANTFYPDTIEGSKFLAKFTNGLNAGTSYIGASEITGWDYYRYSYKTSDIIKLAKVPVDVTGILDYGVGSDTGSYKYYMVADGATKNLTQRIESNIITRCFWEYALLECSKNSQGYYEVINEFLFANNVSTGSVSNNCAPTVQSNFGKYPTVMLSSQNYKSGSLSSLIGSVCLGADATPKYEDTIELRDKIFALSNTTNSLFLKTRKGDVMEIRISSDISVDTMDDTKQQALTVSLSWVEVADATNARLVKFIYD